MFRCTSFKSRQHLRCEWFKARQIQRRPPLAFTRACKWASLPEASPLRPPPIVRRRADLVDDHLDSAYKQWRQDVSHQNTDDTYCGITQRAEVSGPRKHYVAITGCVLSGSKCQLAPWRVIAIPCIIVRQSPAKIQSFTLRD